MNRMSSLPIAEYCGLSPRLGRKHGVAGMAARQSSAFHAMLAGEDASKLRAGLSQDMRDELDGWPDPWQDPPPDPRDPTLALPRPVGEMPLQITTRSGVVLTEGTADMVWKADEDGIVLISDAKRTRYTSSLDSLQLDAYAWAATRASAGARGYLVGLYIIEDGRWLWRPEPVVMGTSEADAIGKRLMHAAMNEKAMTGPHCNDCYQARHCPHIMGPALTALAGHEGAVDLLSQSVDTPESIGEILRLKKAAAELVKMCEVRAKSHVKEHGPVTCGDKVWGPIGGGTSTSRFDVKRMRADRPDIVKEYTVAAVTAPSHRWTNVK